MTDLTWEALLSRFEADLTDAATVHEWVTPTTPLPFDLVDRAQRLVRQQDVRMRDLRRELDDVQAQLMALRRIPSVRTETSALLDRKL